MRFVRVVVRNFQALESADVEFGPGLNVIYGPNDLGKSTLATAMRAALLVPPSSSEAARYRPWFVDAVPEVTLTFQDDGDRYWRVRKTFGATAAQTSAELHHSKDGASFGPDCQGREVEGRLRDILAWGIPSPGGKGAPRKLPTSFLSHVLLAEQTDVDTIFQQSLEEDDAPSGKDRLRKALAALAEDPRFKTVLTQVQRKVSEYFSASGQRKRGRESPFTLAAEEIKRRNERIDDLRKGVAESQSTEELIAELRRKYATAQETHEDAVTALEDVRRQQLRAEERARAEQELAAATAAVSGLDQQARDVVEHERALTELEPKLTALDSEAADARQAVERAEATLREAEAALRTASSEEGLRQRELRRAQLAAERAEIAAQTTRTEQRLEALQAVDAAILAAKAADSAGVAARATAERALATEVAAKNALAEAERDLGLARGLIAYGQYQAARAAGQQAEEAKTNAETLRTALAVKATAAAECEAKATQKLAEAQTLRATLPDPALTARLEELSRDRDLAEAALGGGFSIALRGFGKVPVHVSLDGRDAIAGTAIDGRVVLEGDRTALLRAGDLLDVEIVAGAADQRRALEALRERWTNEAEPILSRAGVATLPEIRERLNQATTLEASANDLQREAKQLRTEAEAARQSAETLDQRAAELLIRASEADELQPQLAALDATLLAARFAELGTTWKQQADALVAVKARAVGLTRETLATATSEQRVAALRATEAADRATEAQSEATRSRSALNLDVSDSEPDSLTTAIAATRAELSTLSSQNAAIDEQFETLAAEDTTAVTAAQTALEAAAMARERAVTEQTQKAQAASEARSQCDTARGHLAALRSALQATDRSGADARLTAARAALEQYAAHPPVPADALEAAERRESEATSALARIRRELDQTEGALSKVGGDPLREELRRAQDAVDLAKKQQRDLEVESDSWKLLHDALEAAEKDGTSHLGNSLAAPVSARLIELTGARYGGVRLDQHLRVETVEVAAAAKVEDVLDALSVGTRDQIATLIRLTIAEQLGSAIILDDHLVHADPERLAWFRSVLREATGRTQVIVITCRAEDYLERHDNTGEPATPHNSQPVRSISFGTETKRFYRS